MDQIVPIVKFAKEKSIILRFIELMPIGHGTKYTPVTGSKIREIIEESFGMMKPINKALGNGPAEYYALEGFSGAIGFISAVSEKFCSTCNRIRLTSNGFLKTCLHYNKGIHLKEYLKKGISEENLMTIISKEISQKKPQNHGFNDKTQNNIEKKKYVSNRRVTRVKGKIMAVCISEKKGTQKYNVNTINLIEEYGIEGDAHAGKWHRQVSLLSFEEIERFKERGAEIDDGAFGENIVVQGIVLNELPVGTQLTCNDVILEVTQIGKECHHHCQIYQKMGECIMPKLGIFARVLQGGTVSNGDTMEVC